MKKILFATTIFLLFVSFASAQSTRFGFTGGFALANMQDKNTGTKVHGDYRFGVTFGLIIDAPMEKNGSFQPGLNFVQRGTKNLVTTGLTTKKTENSLNYLEMPLNVVFKIRHGNGKFLLGGGPAAAIALSGKSTTEVNGVTTKQKIVIGNNATDDMKGVDFGLNVLGGYEMNNGWFVAINYTDGISTLINNGAEHKLFNRYFGLRIGYLLKGKMKGKK